MIIRLLILITCFSLLFSCKPEDAIDNENESNSFVPSGYIKIWEDHFDSTQINTDNWVVGSLVDPISNDTIPGARGAYLLNYKYAGYISENNCYIEDGALVLSNKEEQISGNNPWGQFEFTSGWVHSMHRVFFNKGYVEIKAKFPSGDKVWPALWLISEDLVWGPEWDMWEYFGEKIMLVQTLWDSTSHMMNGPMFNGVHTGFMTLICFMIANNGIFMGLNGLKKKLFGQLMEKL